MFYFGVGAGTGGHADILVAFSKDLIDWDKDEQPLYRAGGHPDGIDAEHAHKISIICALSFSKFAKSIACCFCAFSDLVRR